MPISFVKVGLHLRTQPLRNKLGSEMLATVPKRQILSFNTISCDANQSLISLQGIIWKSSNLLLYYF